MNSSRVGRLREEIAEQGAAGAVIGPGINLDYLTGVALERSERFVGWFLPLAGPSWLVAPAFEVGRLSSDLPGVEILAWEEDEDPFALAGRRLADSGVLWAVEPSIPYHEVATLAAAAEGATFVDGQRAFVELRRAKDADEIACLRQAVDAAWLVYDRVTAELSEGVREAEVAARIEALFGDDGFTGWALVQFGPGSAVPHGSAGDRRLERGMPVLIDWGGWKHGFSADLTRTVWWDGAVAPQGEAPREFREIAELVQSAQRAALDRMAPGVLCGDVDEAARSVIRDAGHGPAFSHRLGHGLGREIHESPYLVAGSEERLAVGDVVTVEPGVYLVDRFGVRWEDDVLVTGGGVDVLSVRGD